MSTLFGKAASRSALRNSPILKLPSERPIFVA
jgi:hypothetical protein